MVANLPAAEPDPGNHAIISSSVNAGAARGGTNTAHFFFDVRGYVIEDRAPLLTNPPAPTFLKYTGTNTSLNEIVQAATDLQEEYRQRGKPSVSIVISEKRITNGLVTMGVFQGPYPQILVSGKRFFCDSNGLAVAVNPPAYTNPPVALAITNATLAPPLVFNQPVVTAAPADAAALARARTLLLAKLAEPEKLPDTRIHVVSTNAGPRFEVEKYLILGNSVLSPHTLAAVLTNIDGVFGTNVSFEGINTAVTEFQKAYRERGYMTVSLGLPQQKLTNAEVKVQVTEGRLAAINVTGNRYYSSNNVMRALPSLHTNMILIRPVFETELNRANASQDRQIYPLIDSGSEPGTSVLTLRVKDQLPLHAKVEFNNEASPGTPDFRVNTSAVYDNLWQLEHQLGVQYSFAPENYQPLNGWGGYDLPMVANYSTFYRLPLGNPAPIGDIININPGSFGYSEATHKFNLPPSSGQPSLTTFASHSTIDTGVTTLSESTVLNVPGVIKIAQKNVQTDLTLNNDIGTRLNIPLPATADFQSGVSGGFDYKNYQLTSNKTNLFTYTTITEDEFGNPLPPTTSVVASPVPTTSTPLNYIPLSFGYNAMWRQPRVMIAFGLGASADVWFQGSVSNFESVADSTQANGYWMVLTPNFSADFVVYTNWILSFKANGQWADQPLISNEQFGAGGVNSVRGYQEGAVFGDTGFHLSLEQKTPAHVVGMVYGNTPLTLRGSIYMDYADTYLLNPNGRPGSTDLWGAGIGIIGAVGSHWEARLLFSEPLLKGGGTSQYNPFFNFSLTGQF
jgi:hemolysin activation/secretion protein